MSRGRKCIYCNKIYYTKQPIHKQRTCGSDECQKKLMHELYEKRYVKKPINIRLCKYCNTKFEVAGNRNKLFCSKNCSKQWYIKNQNSYYKARWKVFVRDNFTCQYCGKTTKDGIKLQADHILPRSKGGKDIEDNLITSCNFCNVGKSNLIFDRNQTKEQLFDIDIIATGLKPLTYR